MRHLLLAALVMAAVAVIVNAAACGGGATETTGQGTQTTTAGDSAAAALFTANCAVCHGGSGQGRSGPDLRPFTTNDLSRIENQIRNGGIAMPPFGSLFSDSQITALADYVAGLPN